MAMSKEADSEVLFKEKWEGKGVKTETAVDDATLRGRRGSAKDRAEEIQP